jgi:hypothetical protein
VELSSLESFMAEIRKSSPVIWGCWLESSHFSYMTRVTENSVSGRNVISGAHRFKIFEGPLVEVPKARVERRICTSFLGGCSPGKCLNLDSLKCHFPDFGERFAELWWSKNDIVTYQMPWPMFLLYSLDLGDPIWPIGVGGPRSQPIVVTPL